MDPYTIDFKGEQLEIVKQTIRNLTPQQIEMAKLYAETTPTEDWAFVINELLEKYDSNPPRAARITGICKAALNDTMVVTWDIKYSTDIARPDQLDPSLQTVIPTPRFPAYPSGHSTMAGCAEVILSHFFPEEAVRLTQKANNIAQSRLYAGVHFPIDNEEGLRLGRQIGNHVIKLI
ncbi:vanadium-dependent haloperoxidase [Thalassobacillus sp. C254]|uniref:vanadium-dependent haloperoxidase n=1 Tax=Thalassobacillus sp. C254 TaxID=1225341 RepID=UPI0006D17797|nr:vanadium-dependent haloperoxidase [Thalassobacillus sp. C254]